MKNTILLIAVTLLGITSSIQSQSILKSNYVNRGSKGVDLGISQFSGANDYILHIGGNYRLTYLNLGADLSAMLGDSLLAPNSGYLSLKAGLALPLHHFRIASTTLNANATYNLFDKSGDTNLTSWGYEVYGKFNLPFGNLQTGYSASPKANIDYLRRDGFFVRVALGLNQFGVKYKGWEFANVETEREEENRYLVDSKYTRKHRESRSNSPNYDKAESSYRGSQGNSLPQTREPIKAIDPSFLENQKAKWNNNGIDPIEGQYDHFSGTSKISFDVVVIKQGDNYNLHYFGCTYPDYMHSYIANLATGDIIGTLYPTAKNGVYKGTYYHPDGRTFEMIAGFDGTEIITLIEDGYTGIEDSYLKIYPSVKDNIENKPISGSSASGTGFAISENGYIATNHHVIENAKEIFVYGINNNFENKQRATLIKQDIVNDLAILKVNTQLGEIDYGFKTDLADVGEDVFALGFPMPNTLGEELKYTDGNISSQSGIRGDITNYQITVPIQPGNSGGPLFDVLGNIVGITSSGIRDGSTQNVNYAIKLRLLKNLTQDISDEFNLTQVEDEEATKDKIKKYRKHVYKIVVTF